MPRAYTDRERMAITERLREAGLDQFVRLGFAKTTVAELARAAGIGKGTFYLFYASKEELFLTLQEEQEAAFKTALLAELDGCPRPRSAIAALLRCVTTRVHSHPFLRMVLDPDIVRELTLHVPPERLDAHRQSDRAFFTRLAEDWRSRGWLRADIGDDLVMDVLEAMFAISSHPHWENVAAMQRASEAIAEALAERWCALR